MVMCGYITNDYSVIDAYLILLEWLYWQLTALIYISVYTNITAQKHTSLCICLLESVHTQPHQFMLLDTYMVSY